MINVYIFILLLSSSLYLTSTFNSIGNVLISSIILTIFPVVVISKKNKIRTQTYSIVLMFLFLLGTGISSLINKDIRLLIEGFVLVSLLLASYIILPSFKRPMMKNLYKTTLWSQLPLIIIPIFLFGINTNPYKGVFYNSNSYGSVVATIYAPLLALFLYKLENYYTKQNKQYFKSIFLYLIGLFTLFYLVVLSGSRTSALAMVAISILGSSLLIFRLFKKKKALPIIKSFIYSIIGGTFIAFLIRATPFYDYLYLNVIYKFQMKFQRGDVLDVRGIVWEQTVREANFFGNGGSYFATETVVGSHNTFISILGELGWIPLLIFMLFILQGTYNSMKYLSNGQHDPYKYMPILIVASFVLLSMGENMMYKLSMIMMFLSIGATFQVKGLVKEKEMESARASIRKLGIFRKRLVIRKSY